ncbi:MAG: phosphoesterase [Candidatus Eremiobacteraeota bacterium]|nr:phosphoesterase [Candidatus Eremiobacteraeota bacterium]
MNIVSSLRGTCTLALVAGLASSAVTPAVAAGTPLVTVQPAADASIAPFVSNPANVNRLPRDRALALLRKRVKYVFVIFQENRSFDSYFGSFPGARNLFSQAPSQTPGYYQQILGTDGKAQTIAPFRIGPKEYAADTDDVDHSFARMGAKMDVRGGYPHMDDFASIEEMKYTVAGSNPTLKAKQYGELTMAYEDCDTIPYLWNYASRFTLFDNYFQHTIGPSTPNAIDMIAGQTGETQWVEHPNQSTSNPILAALGQGEPVVSDNDPFWGSAADPARTNRSPINPGDNPASYQLNQTYASLPLTFNGEDIRKVTGFDKMSASDLGDVRNDIPALAAMKSKAVPWGWFQEGYDREPTDAPGAKLHSSYIGHHNGPQYFGYVSDNRLEQTHLFGLNDFFLLMQHDVLPPRGGVFYIRGGYQNIAGLKPADPDPAVQANFVGDDDHPGYSDAHISEALVAREVNTIVKSPYWKNSAIFITYDESEGDYDHVPPLIQEYSPAGLPLVHGPRIPLIVISPYANAHAVSHESGDHNSLIRFIDELYGLPFLADLPDEAKARKAGMKMFGQPNLGPDDDGNPFNSDLMSAFDVGRLSGEVSPLPAGYAYIPDKIVQTIPPLDNKGCDALGIIPDDARRSAHNPIPSDFNPRPSTDPTVVTSAARRSD